MLIDPGGGAHEKKMSKDHLPRVVYHQVYNVYLVIFVRMVMCAML